jgi:cytochrome P450
VTQYAAHRASQNFFQHNDFLPKRWLSPKQAAKYGFTPEHHAQFAHDNRSACRPFSAGGRDCIGQNLAWFEMRILLARMVWNFEFKVAPRRSKGYSDAINIKDGVQNYSVFASWTDLKAYMLWQKESYFVYLREQQ